LHNTEPVRKWNEQFNLTIAATGGYDPSMDAVVVVLAGSLPI